MSPRAFAKLCSKKGDEGTGEYRCDGAVANRALELPGKEIGMFVDRAEVKNINFDVSDDGTRYFGENYRNR